MDTYYLGCYWKDRKEDADACTNRIVRCLKGLASCDPTLAEVFIVPRSRKAPYSIPVNFETIKPFVEKGRNREDAPPRKIIEKLGYSISFVSNYGKREEQWVMRTMCGAYPRVPGMTNFCHFSFPKKEESAKSLLQIPKATCMMHAMIDAWDPDWVIINGSNFFDYVRKYAGIPQYSPHRAFLGWMAYFAKHLGKVPEELPVYSRTELEHGTLVVLSEDPITLDRPDHVATANAVISSLKQTGLIPAL